MTPEVAKVDAASPSLESITWAAGGALPADIGALGSIACTSVDSCVAVGNTQSTNLAVAAAGAVTNDGGATWMASTFPSSLGYIYGVACPQAQHCVATGTYETSAGGTGASAAAYSNDGGQTWSVAAVASSDSGGLYQPDCVTLGARIERCFDAAEVQDHE